MESNTAQPALSDSKCVDLCKAVAEGDWPAAQRFLDDDPNLFTAPISERKNTVIHVAAVRAPIAFFWQFVQYMRQKGVSLRAKDIENENALHYAARAGRTEEAKLLVVADPSLAQQQNCFGCFPQQVAVQSGHVQTAAHLMPVTVASKTDNIPQVFSWNTKYVNLLRAANEGDWLAGKLIFDSDQGMVTAPLSAKKLTVLHIAAVSSRSAFFLGRLVDYMDVKRISIRAKDDSGRNALHYAARSGNRKGAQILVEKDAGLTLEQCQLGFLPLQIAAAFGEDRLVSYLMPKTNIRDAILFPHQTEDGEFYTIPVGPNLLVLLILGGYYDYAIKLLEQNPAFALQMDPINKSNALWALAHKPEDFPSGSRLPFWKRSLYQVFDWITEKRDTAVLERDDVENPSNRWGSASDRLISPVIFPHYHKRKLRHKKVLQLLNKLIEIASTGTDFSEVIKALGFPSQAAAQAGIHEFVEEVIKAYPLVVSLIDDDGRNIFDYAAMHRQEKVFNLFFRLGSWKGLARGHEKDFNNILHHAANWCQPARRQIEKIPGAALQMQRELQWFKEVEKILPPSYKVEYTKDKDKDKKEQKTAEMLFVESHKELIKEGGEWMKNTANSYTIVAALILTIAFAAAFTVPGGTNGNTGLPMFLHDLSFTIFAIANGLAFFSSVTSLLMVLGILTSRYSQEDFLRALPLRLSIGLISLFLSIVSILVALTAGIHIMLSDRVSWIAIPASMLAFLSVISFAFLQGPLLVEVVYSTWGPSIFDRDSI